MPFSPKAPPLIGLDIGSSSVKIVELSEAGKGTLRLERYAIEPLPRGPSSTATSTRSTSSRKP